MSERSRRRSKTTYERICDTKSKIANTEEKLAQLKQELDGLYTTLFTERAEQNEVEMKKLFDIIEMRHIPLMEVINLLEDQQ